MPEEVTLGPEHLTHSPEVWGTGVSCTGRMGILGVSLAWAWGEVRGAGQLCLGLPLHPPELLDPRSEALRVLAGLGGGGLP